MIDISFICGHSGLVFLCFAGAIMMMNPVRFVLWIALMVTCAPGGSGPTGESEVVGPYEPVRAKVGGDVVLPCYVQPPSDVTNVTVEWKCNKTTVVHMYKNRRDNSDSQYDKFRTRTSLFREEMTRGNISLKLVKVTEADAGSYICSVRKLHDKVKSSNVTLIVDPVGKGREIQKDEDPTTGPETEGFNWNPVYIGVAVIVIIIVAVVLLMIYRRNCTCSGKKKCERADNRQIRNQEGSPLNDIRNN
ncbi:myelin-oligodendrocyte glycoprotein-like isoform X2 [Channa argus]|uniref:myelin-oligodendrocyte glycoprotein-like isoform X2 n=1 Tax=Channa argus TaxID=215402 RepID=UPI003522CF83